MAETSTPPKDMTVRVTGEVTIPGHRVADLLPQLAAMTLLDTGFSVVDGTRAVLDGFLDATGSPEGTIDVRLEILGGAAGSREPAPTTEAPAE